MLTDFSRVRKKLKIGLDRDVVQINVISLLRNTMDANIEFLLNSKFL